jgi:hypothetical protein
MRGKVANSWSLTRQGGEILTFYSGKVANVAKGIWQGNCFNDFMLIKAKQNPGYGWDKDVVASSTQEPGDLRLQGRAVPPARFFSKEK